VVGISRSSGGENSKAKWWGYRGQLVGELQGQVVGISRSSGGENYQGQVVGISRSSSGDIEVKWWGYQGQGEGLRGQGQKKVVGGACPLQLPLLPLSKLHSHPHFLQLHLKVKHHHRTVLSLSRRNVHFSCVSCGCENARQIISPCADVASLRFKYFYNDRSYRAIILSASRR
jgi:hypothetical protein